MDAIARTMAGATIGPGALGALSFRFAQDAVAVMSTHPRSEHDDLDRTDELPRLDVSAYEAQLAADAGDTLASTDTWAVQALREAEEAKEDTGTLRFSRPRVQPPDPPQSAEVTLDATHILGRIQQLESDLEQALERERGLQARVARVGDDLAAKERDVRGLSADNARLTEQRSITIERVRTLEQQLEEESARHERDLTQQRELHMTEQSAAMTARLTLERQLADEEANSAQLARHLAAKIAEHASADHEIARRDASILTLIAARDDLAGLLEASRTEAAALQAQLADKSARFTAIDLTLRESDDALAQRDARLAMLEHELRLARDCVESLTEERDALSTKAGELERLAADLRQSNTALEQRSEAERLEREELEARQREHEASVLANAAELAAARRQLGQQLTATQSLEQAIRARDTLAEHLRAELQIAQDERAIIAGQLEKSRARNKAMAKDIFARDNQIATLKADLAVHIETLAAIRQDVHRASAAVEAEHPDRVLEPVDHDADIVVLNKKTMTIGRTSDNDICIPSKLVSRNHARLLVGPNAVIVEDAGSTNGCLVNGARVKQHVIREGDVLSIGDLKYRLHTRPDKAARLRDNVIPFSQ